MTATPERLAQLSSDQWDRLEAAVARFEEAWEEGAAPALDDYLPADEPARRHTLVELIHADLEYRLKAGQAARVEDYLTRYPELADDAEAVIGLAVREYELRRRTVISLTPDEYAARFPAHGAELLARLRPRPEPPPAPAPRAPRAEPAPAGAAYVDPTPEVEISHRGAAGRFGAEGGPAPPAPARHAATAAPGQRLRAACAATALAAATGLVVWSLLPSRAARLRTEIARAVDAADGSADSLARVEALAAALEPLAPADAAAVRRRLTDRVGQHLRERIAALGTGVVADEDVRRLRTSIDRLAARDAAAAADLHTALDARLRQWLPVAALEGPAFAGHDDVFAPGAVRVENDLLRASAAAPEPTPTRLSAEGDVELTAEFAHPQWEDAVQLGVALNSTGSRGYVIRLVVSGPSRLLQIVRNGVVLRQQQTSAAVLAGRPLRLTVRREGRWWTAKVNDGQPLASFDPFPLGRSEPGALGVLGLAEAPLVRLTAMRRLPPDAAGPLAAADRLFERGEFARALAAYRDRPAGQAREARYKEGLCLLALGREPQAERALEELATGDDHWAVLADSRLWLTFSARNDARADAVLDRLAARERPTEAAALVPEEVSARLVHDYARQPWLACVLTDPAELVRRQERRWTAYRRVRPPHTPEACGVREGLLLAYRLAGREDDALRVAREMPDDLAALGSTDAARRVIEHQSWMLRQCGDATAALAALNGWIDALPQAVGRDLCGSLRLERARTHAALGQWEAAEADTDAVLTAADRPAWLTVQAALLKGFLRERQSDAAGARAAWQAGARAAGGPDADEPGSPAPALAALLVAALADDPGATDATDRLRGRLLDQLRGGEAGTAFDAAANLLPAEVFRAAWRTPRGRDFARRYALRELSQADALRLPVLLLAAEAVRRHAFAAATPEQDRLVWELVRAAHAAHLHGKLGLDATGLTDLVFTFQGPTAAPWPGLRDRLDPALRGPVAYVLGSRYLRLDRRTDAADFFKDALQAAAPGTPLQRLAMAELGKLAPP